MSGSSLTSYNSELVKALEDLREQREEMNRSILRDEEEKARIQKVRQATAFATSEFTRALSVRVKR
jgi:Sjoegren syndrome nuclear autoantigen 1